MRAAVLVLLLGACGGEPDLPQAPTPDGALPDTFEACPGIDPGWCPAQLDCRVAGRPGCWVCTCPTGLPSGYSGCLVSEDVDVQCGVWTWVRRNGSSCSRLFPACP